MDDFPAGSRHLADRLHGLDGIALERGPTDAVQQQPKTLDEFLDLAEHAARLLAGVHGRGVRHGDLRPDRLLERAGRLLLTGFERASIVADEWPEMLTVEPGSTAIAYLAPEQTGRMNRPVDERADLYSLGATLYALATGQPPFAGRTGLDLIRSHLAEPPQPPKLMAGWMPEPLSELILTLLAKEPDDRPQSAAAVAATLRHYRVAIAAGRSWQDPQSSMPHQPARLRLPRQLRGRDQPLAELCAAIESARQGRMQCLFVTGGSGVGKTFLVHELARPASLAAGFFVAGTCGPSPDQQPLLAPIQAVRQLCRLLTSESIERIKPIRLTLAEELGSEVSSLISSVPEAAALLGLPADTGRPGLSVPEARLHTTLLQLLRVVARGAGPVVLVLDDMHAADRPTLELLRDVLERGDVAGLVVVVSYRDASLADSHPLSHLLRQEAAWPTPPRVIRLAGLPPESLRLVVGDMLGSSPDQVRRLADELHQATDGNPCDAVELLRSLHKATAIHQKKPGGQWVWRPPFLVTKHGPRTAASFIAHELASLPADSLEPLTATACLGSGCQLGLLASVSGKPPADLALRLLPALEQGILVTSDTTALMQGSPTAAVRFRHEVFRQAAYGLLDAAARERLHLAIARHQAEAEVQARIEQLRAAERTLAQSAYELTENIPVGTYILEFDRHGAPRFTFLSQRWLKMVDLRREDVLADHSLAFQVVHPAEQEEFARLNAQVLAEKKRFSWEGRIVVRGETRWVSIESIPRDRADGGTIWEGVMIDVTQRVEAVAALAESENRHRRQLEEKLKTSLEAAAVAHEIKQPLARVLLQAKLAAQDPAGRDAALEVITTEARVVERVIEKMRVLLRSVQTSHAPVDLRAVITSSLLQVKWQISEHGIDVVERGFSKPALLDGDDAQLQLAVANLLRNAIESITEASPPVRRITLTLRRGRGHATLAIGDSGLGWSGAERRQLPFTTTKPSGSGIGLMIVRTVVEHHAGEVSFHRSADGGAEVRLRFPAIAAGPAATRQRRNARHRDSYQ